jgi:hypothetical protein
MLGHTTYLTNVIIRARVHFDTCLIHVHIDNAFTCLNSIIILTLTLATLSLTLTLALSTLSTLTPNIQFLLT